MIRFVSYALIGIVVIGGGAFLFLSDKSIELFPADLTSSLNNQTEASKENKLPLPKPLENPPDFIKAIYATNWSAGTPSKLDYLIELIEATELNALVVDIKDYSGYVGYETAVPEVKKYNAEEIRISDIDSLVRKLHEKNIYAIARMTIFQDPRLALARPDLAIKNKLNGGLWKDNKGLTWPDPASREVWDYNVKIAKNVLSHGFDEINFDYIRFPSDGNLGIAEFPFWNGTTTLKSAVMRNFYRYLRENLPDARISADVFGQTTVNTDDLGIGQLIEDAYESFDYVAPMVYPSHYINGFINFQNPAAHPYEVVKYSMDSALLRLKNYESGIGNNGTSTISTNPNSSFVIHNSKLRPWLQAFDLGADYTPEMIRLEIKAVYDSASTTPSLLNGFMLWSSSNIYDRRALVGE